MAAITGDRRVGPGPCHARAPQSVRSPPVRDPPPSDPWADGPAPQQHHSDLRRVPSRDNEADYEDRSGWRRAPQIGRAHVSTPVTNAHLVCRLLLEIT